MRPGTPRFVGERLRQAREARGLTAVSLSDLIGVSRQAVSQYENGPQTPAPDVMRRIADRLGLPMHFFLRPSHVTRDGVVFYRSMASATKAARARAERRFEWARELVRFLRLYVDLPAVNLPPVDMPPDPLGIGERQVEEAAAAARRHWRLGDGPISNVVLLLENNGVVVARHSLAADTLDAFSMWSPEERSPYIVLNSDKCAAARSRHDAAHELGHLVLHRNAPPGALSRPELFDVIEAQAHAFARAFLMPEKGFAADLIAPTLDSFRSLKPKWKVSIQGMIRRARDLRLVDSEQERRLWANLARRGWRTREPLDDELEPETPKLLRRSVELIVSSGATTRQDIVFQNALPANEIEDLVGLAQGYLSGAPPGGPDAGHDPEAPRILRFPMAG